MTAAQLHRLDKWDHMSSLIARAFVFCASLVALGASVAFTVSQLG